jgi:hypothetical protein
MEGGATATSGLIAERRNSLRSAICSGAAKRAEIVKPSASAPEGPPLLRGRMSRRSDAQRGQAGGEA